MTGVVGRTPAEAAKVTELLRRYQMMERRIAQLEREIRDTNFFVRELDWGTITAPAASLSQQVVVDSSTRQDSDTGDSLQYTGVWNPFSTEIAASSGSPTTVVIGRTMEGRWIIISADCTE